MRSRNEQPAPLAQGQQEVAMAINTGNTTNPMSSGYVSATQPKQSSVQEQLNELDKAVESIRADAEALIGGISAVLRDEPRAPTAHRPVLASRCSLATQIATMDSRLSSISDDLRDAFNRLEV